MKEERVYFGEGRMRMEGLFATAEGTKGAVISHPHSLMGGDMWNPVVETVTQALFSVGFSTLRFNFRGVGGSGGSFDNGQGEQEDLLSALAFLEDRALKEILPAGYSFGAWVTAGVTGRRALAPALFVAPPIEMFPFDLETLKNRVGLIVCGDRDPYCPADRVRIMATTVSCRLESHPGRGSFLYVARSGSCRLYQHLCAKWEDIIAAARQPGTPGRVGICASGDNFLFQWVLRGS